jgi:predicted O-methyltransferase YrrM
MQTTVQRPIYLAQQGGNAETGDPARFLSYLEVAQQIPGWFLDESAAIWDIFLSRQMQTGVAGHVMEIGVYKGKSALLMAMHARQEEEVVLVDIDSLADAESIIKHLGKENVHYLQMESFDLISTDLVSSGGNKFRWISIDAEHTREAVHRDLGFANQLLSRDGIISMDDFFQPAYPQITAAVYEFLAQHAGQLTMILCGYNKAYLCRPRAAQQYLDFIRESMGAALEARGAQVSLFKTTEPTDYNVFGAVGLHGNPRYKGPDWDVELIRT